MFLGFRVSVGQEAAFLGASDSKSLRRLQSRGCSFIQRLHWGMVVFPAHALAVGGIQFSVALAGDLPLPCHQSTGQLTGWLPAE